eukprot:929828-Pyramimonas_sp.AAC.1
MSSGRSLIQSLKSTPPGMGWRSSMAFVAQQQMHSQPVDHDGLADPFAHVRPIVVLEGAA